MPIYHRLGQIPRKRHIAFRKPDGGIYAEELMGHEGFVGTSSLLYHTHPPTTVKSARQVREVVWEADEETSLRHRHFLTRKARKGGSATLDRIPILVKQYNAINELLLDHHPFDVVGWDGYFYPWAFNIHDFEPIVGRIHQPPPVHQTFQGDGFVICSFCPRPYDFDPQAVPAPYNHSNVDSDEVLFYASSEFMSRKGIEYASITLHPDGIPHGPHPGRTEASLGAQKT